MQNKQDGGTPYCGDFFSSPRRISIPPTNREEQNNRVIPLASSENTVLSSPASLKQSKYYIHMGSDNQYVQIHALEHYDGKTQENMILVWPRIMNGDQLIQILRVLKTREAREICLSRIEAIVLNDFITDASRLIAIAKYHEEILEKVDIGRCHRLIRSFDDLMGFLDVFIRPLSKLSEEEFNHLSNLLSRRHSSLLKSANQVNYASIAYDEMEIIAVSKILSEYKYSEINMKILDHLSIHHHSKKCADFIDLLNNYFPIQWNRFIENGEQLTRILERASPNQVEDILNDLGLTNQKIEINVEKIEKSTCTIFKNIVLMNSTVSKDLKKTEDKSLGLLMNENEQIRKKWKKYIKNTEQVEKLSKILLSCDLIYQLKELFENCLEINQGIDLIRLLKLLNPIRVDLKKDYTLKNSIMVSLIESIDNKRIIVMSYNELKEILGMMTEREVGFFLRDKMRREVIFELVRTKEQLKELSPHLNVITDLYNAVLENINKHNKSDEVFYEHSSEIFPDNLLILHDYGRIYASEHKNADDFISDLRVRNSARALQKLSLDEFDYLKKKPLYNEYLGCVSKDNYANHLFTYESIFELKNLLNSCSSKKEKEILNKLTDPDIIRYIIKNKSLISNAQNFVKILELIGHSKRIDIINLIYFDIKNFTRNFDDLISILNLIPPAYRLNLIKKRIELIDSMRHYEEILKQLDPIHHAEIIRSLIFNGISIQSINNEEKSSLMNILNFIQPDLAALICEQLTLNGLVHLIGGERNINQILKTLPLARGLELITNLSQPDLVNFIELNDREPEVNHYEDLIPALDPLKCIDQKIILIMYFLKLNNDANHCLKMDESSLDSENMDGFLLKSIFINKLIQNNVMIKILGTLTEKIYINLINMLDVYQFNEMIVDVESMRNFFETLSCFYHHEKIILYLDDQEIKNKMKRLICSSDDIGIVLCGLNSNVQNMVLNYIVFECVNTKKHDHFISIFKSLEKENYKTVFNKLLNKNANYDRVFINKIIEGLDFDSKWILMHEFYHRDKSVNFYSCTPVLQKITQKNSTNHQCEELIKYIKYYVDCLNGYLVHLYIYKSNKDIYEEKVSAAEWILLSYFSSSDSKSSIDAEELERWETIISRSNRLSSWYKEIKPEFNRLEYLNKDTEKNDIETALTVEI